MRESGQFDVQITVMTAFPGTPLYARLKAEGGCSIEGAWEQCTLFDVNFQPHADVARDAAARGARARRRLYTDDERAARRQRFHDQRRRFLRRQNAMRCSA